MPDYSPVSFSEVWEKTLKNHANDIFLVFENFIKDFKLLPVPEIKTAVLILL